MYPEKSSWLSNLHQERAAEQLWPWESRALKGKGNLMPYGQWGRYKAKSLMEWCVKVSFPSLKETTEEMTVSEASVPGGLAPFPWLVTW